MNNLVFIIMFQLMKLSWLKLSIILILSTNLSIETYNGIEQQQNENEQLESEIQYTRLGIPRIVWTYWHKQLEENDHYLKMFVQNRDQMVNRGWIIRELNEVSVGQWLDAIPDYGNALNRIQFKIEDEPKRSDLIRIALLKHYGGVYMDFTTILIENLDWIENLDQQEDIDYRFGDSPDVFLMYNSDHGYKRKVRDPYNNKQFLLFPTFQLFFMAAKPKSAFLQQVFEFFTFGRAEGYKRYGETRQKSYINDIRRHQSTKTGAFQTFYFQAPIAAEIVLQRKQKQLDKVQKMEMGTKKYAIKQYKIWVLGTNTSAYFYENVRQTDLITILAQGDISLLKANNLYPKYFLKLYSKTSYQLERFLIVDKQQFKKQTCKWDFYINNNSILNKHLLKFYGVKFYLNPIQSNLLPHSCRSYRNTFNLLQSKKSHEMEQNLKKLRQKDQKLNHQLQFYQNLSKYLLTALVLFSIFLIVISFSFFFIIVFKLNRQKSQKQKVQQTNDSLDSPQTNEILQKN